MLTSGEQFTQRLLVEAPDFCSDSCSKLAEWLLSVSNEVDDGTLDPEIALDPYMSLVKSCPRAVEAGGINATGAAYARQHLNALELTRREKVGPAIEQLGVVCAIETTAFSHADMYARAEDPYFGYMDE
jgi:hypothetical protein